MKKLLLVLLMFPSAIVQAGNTVEADSKITDVTVFLQGTQVTRQATVQLKKGENIVAFKGLTGTLDPNSLQATAPSLVTINSVTHEVNYLKDLKPTPQIKALVDRKDAIGIELSTNNDERSVIDMERKMLLANQQLKGDQKGVTVEELRKTADFFRQRLQELNADLAVIALEDKKLNEELSQINRQLNEWNAKRNQPSNDIIVKIQSNYDRNMQVAVRYLVTEAGWTPIYDLRAKDTNQPIRLDYRAQVYQQTGIDWKQVKLTLSTANPNQSGTKPSLSQWNLRFGSPGYATGTVGNSGVFMYDYKEKDKDGADAGGRAYAETLSQTLADRTVMTEGATSVQFEIDVKQDLLSTNKPQQVAIQKFDVPATFQHFAVPKLDQSAFLLARVTDWEGLNLLAGQVNIYFQGTYVSQAYMNPSQTSDTLDFSMGRDPKVIIERNQLKDRNKTRLIGSNRERTFAYEIVVRNTKSSAVSLVLEDQLPISQDNDIQIKVEETTDASRNEDTGKLSWELDLEPGETRKITLIYSVKYPKDRVIPGL